MGASGLVTAYLSTAAIKVSHLGRGEDNGGEDDHRICGRALFRSMRIMSRSHLKQSGSSQVTLDGLQVLLRNAQHVLLGIIPVHAAGNSQWSRLTRPGPGPRAHLNVRGWEGAT